ncbi:MAG: hypothetical protein GTO46_09530 [Gemmatimonadetes bacterium]|nr:hypothetical protein [Gemmatimonadota bacterium]NIO31856.1 hypothetical protein [Gemmatimonadota bacterium]
MQTETAGYTDEQVLNRITGRIPGRALTVLGTLVGLGFIGFVIGLFAAPQRVWQAYLVNFLFFSGLAAAGVLFGAAMQLAKGHWGKSMHRVAQGFGAFLPASYLLFLVLYFGNSQIFPWIGNAVNTEGHPLPEAWFNVGGLFLRGAVFLALLYVLCLVFMYYALRPDMPAAASRLSGWRRALTDWMARGFKGEEQEAERSRRILGRLAPILALSYAVMLSGMAVDLIMSLTPGWLSVLYPAYFFIGAWLSALAGLAVMATLFRRYLGLDFFAANQWHDLGKLIFAFCIFWAYLWFSQYLPIWYGNMPRETLFIEVRSLPPWQAFSMSFLACVFVIPFLLLLWQKVKMVPPYLASVAGLILLGLWLERFVAVVPSIWTGGGVPLGLIELLMTLGFLGLFGICYALYASTFPLLPLHDSIIVGAPRKGPY